MARWYSKQKKLSITKIVKKPNRAIFCGGIDNDYFTPICNRRYGQCYSCFYEQYEVPEQFKSNEGEPKTLLPPRGKVVLVDEMHKLETE